MKLLVMNGFGVKGGTYDVDEGYVPYIEAKKMFVIIAGILLVIIGYMRLNAADAFKLTIPSTGATALNRTTDVTKPDTSPATTPATTTTSSWLTDFKNDTWSVRSNSRTVMSSPTSQNSPTVSSQSPVSSNTGTVIIPETPISPPVTVPAVIDPVVDEPTDPQPTDPIIDIDLPILNIDPSISVDL